MELRLSQPDKDISESQGEVYKQLIDCTLECSDFLASNQPKILTHDDHTTCLGFWTSA